MRSRQELQYAVNASKQKIAALKNRLAFAQQQESAQQANNANVSNNAESTQALINDIKQQLQENEDKRAVQQQIITNLNDCNQRLINRKYDLYGEAQNLGSVQAELESQKMALDIQVRDLSDSLKKIDDEIAECYSSLQEKEPEPQFEIDGEYCINGIYHCQNHPPRQVCVNKDEIERFRRNRQLTRQELEELTKQRNHIQQEYDHVNAQDSDIANQLAQITARQDEIQSELSNILHELNSNEDQLREAENIDNQLLSQNNYLESQLQQLMSDYDNLSAAMNNTYSSDQSASEQIRMQIDQEMDRLANLMYEMETLPAETNRIFPTFFNAPNNMAFFGSNDGSNPYASDAGGRYNAAEDGSANPSIGSKVQSAITEGLSEAALTAIALKQLMKERGTELVEQAITQSFHAMEGVILDEFGVQKEVREDLRELRRIYDTVKQGPERIAQAIERGILNDDTAGAQQDLGEMTHEIQDKVNTGAARTLHRKFF